MCALPQTSKWSEESLLLNSIRPASPATAKLTSKFRPFRLLSCLPHHVCGLGIVNFRLILGFFLQNILLVLYIRCLQKFINLYFIDKNIRNGVKIFHFQKFVQNIEISHAGNVNLSTSVVAFECIHS